MSIEDDLRRFIVSEILPDGETTALTPTDPLISSGRVDSIGLLTLLGCIHQHYQVDLFETGGPDDFETIAALAAAVQRVRPR